MKIYWRCLALSVFFVTSAYLTAGFTGFGCELKLPFRMEIPAKYSHSIDKYSEKVIPSAVQNSPPKAKPAVKPVNSPSSLRKKEIKAIYNVVYSNSDISPSEALKLSGIIYDVTSEYEKKYHFKRDVPLLLSLIYNESRFHRSSCSRAGARGLLQLTRPALKSVCTDWGTYHGNFNMYNPEHNIRVGYYYICRNKNQMGLDTAIVAYNRGYRNIKYHLHASRRDKNSYLSRVLNKRYYFKTQLARQYRLQNI